MGCSSVQPRRARDHGIEIGRLPTGSRNAITDVAGVRVGHQTVVRDPDPGGKGAVRTGVTAVFPHEGLPWEERVYVGTHVLNGYGELIGINQLNEWGVLHSPIVLTSSLAIGKAYDATVRWRSLRHATTTWEGGDMPVVSECDDSFLNDVTTFPLSDEDVFAALDGASGGEVQEGCVGAGTGMQCFDFKGGIGTASRVVPAGFTVGSLVLTNFGSARSSGSTGWRSAARSATSCPRATRTVPASVWLRPTRRCCRTRSGGSRFGRGSGSRGAGRRPTTARAS